jgi:hypothetical protein
MVLPAKVSWVHCTDSNWGNGNSNDQQFDLHDSIFPFHSAIGASEKVEDFEKNRNHSQKKQFHVGLFTCESDHRTAN